MNIAVLTLTRDRLDYTKHCFATLERFAGCEYDHYVLDQGSVDGTKEWLAGNPSLRVRSLDGNVGVCPGLNMLLQAVTALPYDVIVKFDNDCELTTPGTLRHACNVALGAPAIVSPRIHGLRQPPPTVASCDGIDVTPVIGGIFMAVPAYVFTDYGYRHNERNPMYGGDDTGLCHCWQQNGGIVGYLAGYEAWHYETTDGQHARYPDYFLRKELEAAA